MAIKRVVDKPKTQIVKKFPEYDRSKIYVGDVGNTSVRIIKYGDVFTFNSLFSNDTNWLKYDSFSDMLNRENLTTYAIDNKEEFARFILGCREFPKLEAKEEEITDLLPHKKEPGHFCLCSLRIKYFNCGITEEQAKTKKDRTSQ